MRINRRWAAAFFLAIAFVATPEMSVEPESRGEGAGGETYTAVAVDAVGQLVITTSDSKTVRVAKVKDQTEFSRPVISASGNAVGAQAMFGNCCTSYDIPLQLVVYANGRLHRFTGINLPIWRWHFTEADRRIAFAQSEVHFACRTHYELRDIPSERLIESADIPEPCGQLPNQPTVRIPKWVAELDEERNRIASSDRCAFPSETR